MAFSATLCARLSNRRQAFGLCGSLAAHVGIAACFIHAPGDLRPAVSVDGPDSQGAMTVSLYRPVSLATATSAPPPLRSTVTGVRPAPDRTTPGAPPGTVHDGDGVALERASLTDNPTDQAAQGPAAELDAAVGNDYQRRLLQHIEPFKRYPDDERCAKARRGVVQLLFEIDRRGRLLGIWVARSSGSPKLDAAAIDTVRRAEPLPPIPPGLPDAVTVQLPVEFSTTG